TLRRAVGIKRQATRWQGDERRGKGRGTRCRFSIGSALLMSFTEIDGFPVLKSEAAKPDRT
ncbi:MAG: hypothetical protein E7I12_14660, partial [Clostridium perfringens]|nr:hypothetical protein [Clostridium perfringens]